jgi:uncharacterized metal-binding protein YceD (DUF177 family)
MPAGLPDKVDCERLAREAAVVERLYQWSELHRLQDLLADGRDAVHTDGVHTGAVRASFAFKSVGARRAGATVRVEAEPNLVCQRCLHGFSMAIAAESDIEFVEGAAAVESQREIFVMDRGRVSLRELAEEELLLAIPAIAACASPETCGNAPSLDGERMRPLAHTAGFIEENLIGQSTHGSSKK